MAYNQNRLFWLLLSKIGVIHRSIKDPNEQPPLFLLHVYQNGLELSKEILKIFLKYRVAKLRAVKARIKKVVSISLILSNVSYSNAFINFGLQAAQV